MISPENAPEGEERGRDTAKALVSSFYVRLVKVKPKSTDQDREKS